ncbi:hypothetical protein [Comamonas sp.]|uniref:hypothetical protein n=1 Tax=Comamonas sp. TaxID=34028 RepID=UPI003D11E504
MDVNQTTSVALSALSNAKSSTEYCLLWGDWQIREWWSCLPASDWSSWVQAIIAGIAILVAVALPMLQRFIDKNDARKNAARNAELTIRFHYQLFRDNDSFLSVALKHLPPKSGNAKPGAEREVRLSIDALRAVDFENIKVIALGNPDLADSLADYHCALETLKGVLSRNPEGELSWLAPTILDHLSKIRVISEKISSLVK